MKKIPYTNPTRQPQFIAGMLIPAGATRVVDATLVPGYAPEPAVPQPHTPSALDSFLGQPTATILDALSAISTEELATPEARERLERMAEGERNGAARGEVLGAIAERLLDAAGAAHDAPVPASEPSAPPSRAGRGKKN